MGYALSALDDLVHSDALNRQPTEVVQSLDVALTKLSAAVDAWKPAE